MKKRLLSGLLIAGMILALAACGGKGASDTNKTEDSTSAPSSDTVQKEDVPAETPFEKFEAAMDDAGYDYEKVTMGAELVGAKTGVKYEFKFGKAELYQFEDGSEALSKAIEDNGLTLEGFGVFPCKFNGNLAILIDVSENEEDILSLFNSL